MNRDSSLDLLPFGLLELDANGTILYFKPEDESGSIYSPSDITGHNFFTDIAPIAEAREFQDRIKTFTCCSAPADSFYFTFDSTHNYFAVKVLLARIHKQSVLGSAESVLIHISPKAQKGLRLEPLNCVLTSDQRTDIKGIRICG